MQSMKLESKKIVPELLYLKWREAMILCLVIISFQYHLFIMTGLEFSRSSERRIMQARSLCRIIADFQVAQSLRKVSTSVGIVALMHICEY